nr:unnamed protein product [Callosobruchus chinensis]
MKFSTAVVTLAFLVCAVRCGVILDKLKKVRCDLHHMGDSLISHGHLISNPCPHEQAVNADVTKYDSNRQDVVSETPKHGSAVENSEHGEYGQKELIKSKQHEINADNHDSYEGQLVGSHNLPPKKNENSSDNTYQGQRVSSTDSATTKKNIDMEEVHAGAILFPGETGGGHDDIHGSSTESGMDGVRFDHTSTTMISVLTTTKAADIDLERNLGKVKPNCPHVDRKNNCITDYS